MTMKSDANIQEGCGSAQPDAPSTTADNDLRSIVVVAGIIVHEGKVLITRRPSNVHLADLWEFPGGKVEHGESLHDALQRELREEIGIETIVHDEFFTITHRYPDKLVELHFFNCFIRSGAPRALEVADFRWVNFIELPSFAFPEADRELIDRLVRPHVSL